MTCKEELINAFGREYGRLCTQAAYALTQGHSRALVSEAVCGRGNAITPVYVKLRKQRSVANHALHMAKAADVSLDSLALVGREVRKMAEQEWLTPIPMFSEATS